MDKVLQQAATPGALAQWLLFAFLVGFFLYKEWPGFKKTVSDPVVKDKTLEDRLASIEADVAQIKDKLARDYGRLNDMEKWKRSMEQIVTESLEEREILMQAMLGVLGGLRQLGANGPTEEATDTINRYINKQAHKREREQ